MEEFVAEKLTWLDYTVFSTLMLMSAMIGVYFAFFAKQKQNTTSEYLTGGKNMPTFPIAMSMIASYFSGVAMLGVPAEIYMFGTQYAAVLLSEPTVSLVTGYVFMPVFYKLQLYSAFEYLVMRYNNSVRLMLSILYLFMTVMFTPMIIYIPSLAFAQVSGVNMYLVATVTCAVCIFYTSLGGLKAVVWTDTLQSFSIIVGMLVVAIVGTIQVGGFNVVIERAAESGRFEFFNFDPNPLVRHTFWTVTIGNFFTWLAHLAANQALLQRCLALPSLEKAQRAINCVAIGVVFFVLFSVYSGLVIYARYHDCDPVTTRAIRKVDQIVPFAVMDFAIKIPGFPGLFIAGVFSAALSTMSTSLNSLSGVILQEFIKPCLGERQLSERAASNIMKLIVLIAGSFCTALIFFVDQLGGIIQLSRTISGVTAGTMLGIFVLGMTVPQINTKGAIVGSVVSLLVTGWVAFGMQQALATGAIRYQTKPLDASNCSYAFPTLAPNATLENVNVAEAFWLYRLSYLYLAVLGFVVMVIVATIVSYITGFNDPGSINRDLLSPMVHRFLPPLPLQQQQLDQEMKPLKEAKAKRR